MVQAGVGSNIEPSAFTTERAMTASISGNIVDVGPSKAPGGPMVLYTWAETKCG